MAALSATTTLAQRQSASRAGRRAGPLATLLALVMLLHLPFLNRAVQSDEVNYLDLAENALRHPLAPPDMPYIFQGGHVDLAGHPHPPLNAYLLAALWKARGRFSERFFHAAYLLFPLMATVAMYFLAARFSRPPWLAAALFATAPVVQVISHSFESDSPTLAFGLAGVTLFIYGVDGEGSGRLWAGGVALSLAALGALQALFLLPVAALYLWLYRAADRRPFRTAVTVCALPAVAVAAWQLIEAAVLGRVPAAVLAGYMVNRGLLAAKLKLYNFLALTQHAAVLVVFLPVLGILFWRYLPRGVAIAALAAAAFGAWSLEGYRGFERGLFLAFFAAGLMLLAALARLALSGSEQRDTSFLAAWFLLYFLACVVAFFAGAARYLLLGLPALVLLSVRILEAWPQRQRKILAAAALGGNLLLGLALAHADYQFAEIHRVFAHDLQRRFLRPGEPFLFNGEWGFRHYLKALGGEILWNGSIGRPSEYLFTSRLALGGDYDSLAEEAAVPLTSELLRTSSPVRIIDLGGDQDRVEAGSAAPARAGFLSVGFGLLPFSFSRGPLDEIRIARLSPFLGLLDQARVEPAGSEVLLTQIDFPEGRRLVLRQTPGSSVNFPIPGAWRRLRGALFARGSGRAEFSVQLDGARLMATGINTGAGGDTPTAWAQFAVELPLHRPGAPLTLRIDAPQEMRVGWGGVLAE